MAIGEVPRVEFAPRQLSGRVRVLLQSAAYSGDLPALLECRSFGVDRWFYSGLARIRGPSRLSGTGRALPSMALAMGERSGRQ